MKIAIIGASRGIGAELLKAAIEEGHEVTVLVRDLAKLNISTPGFKVITGDILDPSSVAAAIAGQDAICVCVGIPPTRKPVMSSREEFKIFLQQWEQSQTKN